jgi:hypothetical protein
MAAGANRYRQQGEQPGQPVPDEREEARREQVRSGHPHSIRDSAACRKVLFMFDNRCSPGAAV